MTAGTPCRGAQPVIPPAGWAEQVERHPGWYVLAWRPGTGWRCIRHTTWQSTAERHYIESIGIPDHLLLVRRDPGGQLHIRRSMP